MRNYVVYNLIEKTKNLSSIYAFFQANGKEGYEALSRNKNLTIDLWAKMLTKAKINVATNLYSRELSEEQVEIALRDKRVYARRALLCFGLGKVSESTVDKVINQPWVTEDMLKTLLHYGNNLTSSQRREASLKVGGGSLIRQLGNAEAFPDIVEVVALLKKYEYSLTPWDIAPVFEKRAELVKYMDDLSEQHFKNAFASSWNLVRTEDQWRVYGEAPRVEKNQTTWVNFLRNPYTCNEIVEKIMSNNLKKWHKDFKSHLAVWSQAPGSPLTTELTKLTDEKDKERAVYFKKFHSFHRILPWESPDISRTQHVNLDKIYPNKGSGAWGYSTDWEKVDSDLSDLLTSESSWLTFWSILPSWEGNLQELAETSAKL